MIFYARHFIKRAFNSYVEYHETNMETLIALGSISAFLLFLFFIVKYWIEYSTTGAAAGKAIMDVNEALTSASIVVLVVTIGKYFEEQIKRRISKLT